MRRFRTRVRLRLSRHSAQPRWTPDNRHDRRGPLSALRSGCRGIRHPAPGIRHPVPRTPLMLQKRLVNWHPALFLERSRWSVHVCVAVGAPADAISPGWIFVLTSRFPPAPEHPPVTNRPVAPLRGRFVTSRTSAGKPVEQYHRGFGHTLRPASSQELPSSPGLRRRSRSGSARLKRAHARRHH